MLFAHQTCHYNMLLRSRAYCNGISTSKDLFHYSRPQAHVWLLGDIARGGCQRLHISHARQMYIELKCITVYNEIEV